MIPYMTVVINIRSQLDKIARNARADKLEPLEVQLLIKTLQEMKRIIRDTKAELYPMKSTCKGILRAFSTGIGWKDIRILKQPAVQINNLIALANILVNRPEKALEEYGSFSDIKGNIDICFRNLINALNVLVNELQPVAA